jgi:RNAse (barnase) inhibitor barstar
MPAKSKQLEPKKPVYQPPKDKGRDLDDIWDEITDDGDSLSLRDLGLD